MRVELVFATVLSSLGAAEAHDVWAEGTPIPKWIKAACCSPADAHHLRPDQVRRVSEDYCEVDGYFGRVAAADALPSQDGEYWIFYKDNKSGTQTGVFCSFAPMAF
ncbi:hypothetical protein DFR50_13468 [Roseiarcus fermentans]|uniref:Uncharacterized protein n=1 Tax=Roseiarcus fermentans TaxID=1473586 RepID=A0A366EW41_9HYPH|nr:hypothetical protein [Roseiarcus fermentans]RBP05705.1 hypothetical protein DFR50_13468 [Roseiarcus fermentans]